MPKKLIVIKVRKKDPSDVNEELQWLGDSLGLFNLRDKDSSCFRIFITLIKRSHQNLPITSDDIAAKLNLTRGTVVHHLHRLMESGMVVKEEKGYLLRENNLQRLIMNMRRDLDEIFLELYNVAKDIDEKLS